MLQICISGKHALTCAQVEFHSFFIHTQLLHRLTATRRHRRDLQRVRVGRGDGLLLVLGGHFDGLADERQLLAGDDVVVHRAVGACGRRD